MPHRYGSSEVLSEGECNGVTRVGSNITQWQVYCQKDDLDLKYMAWMNNEMQVYNPENHWTPVETASGFAKLDCDINMHKRISGI
jgi:hypothetical protein